MARASSLETKYTAYTILHCQYIVVCDTVHYSLVMRVCVCIRPHQVTYVDIAVYQVLRATEAQFPSVYASLPFAKLLAFKSRMDARPRIKAYLESSRCLHFCGNSMM